MAASNWLGYLILPLILYSEALNPSLCPLTAREIVRFPVSQVTGKAVVGMDQDHCSPAMTAVCLWVGQKGALAISSHDPVLRDGQQFGSLSSRGSVAGGPDARKERRDLREEGVEGCRGKLTWSSEAHKDLGCSIRVFRAAEDGLGVEVRWGLRA